MQSVIILLIYVKSVLIVCETRLFVKYFGVLKWSIGIYKNETDKCFDCKLFSQSKSSIIPLTRIIIDAMVDNYEAKIIGYKLR